MNKPITKIVKDSMSKSFPLNQEVTLKADGSGGPISIAKKKGEKDACYHKVRARYDVWPSAYASGALTKCRKVGAANWGNKSKNKK
jgi:hypothetical protein